MPPPHLLSGPLCWMLCQDTDRSTPLHTLALPPPLPHLHPSWLLQRQASGPCPPRIKHTCLCACSRGCLLDDCVSPASLPLRVFLCVGRYAQPKKGGTVIAQRAGARLALGPCRGCQTARTMCSGIAAPRLRPQPLKLPADGLICVCWIDTNVLCVGHCFDFCNV